MKRAWLVRLTIGIAAIGVLVFATGAGGAGASKTLVLTIAHGPLTASNSQYVDAAPAGPSVGDVRTFFVPFTKPAGYATGTLTTVAGEKPSAGFELRTANLVFVVGGATNQVVVGGVAAYPETAPTVATRTVITRPVIGGSGKYAGARGWCVTTHYANDTWTHVFHLTLDRP